MSATQSAPDVIGSRGNPKRFRTSLAVIALLFIAAVLTFQASTVLMWYDEVATYEPAHLPDLSRTVGFFTQGYDTPSPIPAMLVWLSIHTIGDGDLKDRLVFIAIYVVMCGFLYLFAGRRYPQGYALASILLWAAIPIREQAYTLRAYGLLLCGAAGMMYFWQQLAEGRRRRANLAGLWLSFVLAVLAHVYGAFLFVPFAVAEVVRTGTSLRKADRAVWGALLTAPVISVLVLAPSVLAARAHYARNFWSQANLKTLVEAYTVPFRMPGLALLVFLFAVTLAAKLLWRPNADSRTVRERGFTRPEWALVWGLVALPVVGAAAALVLGPFHPRYVLPGLLGVDLLMMATIARISGYQERVGYLIAGVLFIYAVAAQHRGLNMVRHGHYGEQLVREAKSQPWIKAVCESPLPAVAATPHDYLEYKIYAPPCVERKLFYISDEKKALRVPALFTDEENMVWFSKYLPDMRVRTVDEFLRENREFLVYSHHTPPAADAGWLLPELIEGSGPMQLLDVKRYPSPVFDEFTVYHVRRK